MVGDQVGFGVDVVVGVLVGDVLVAVGVCVDVKVPGGSRGKLGSRRVSRSKLRGRGESEVLTTVFVRVTGGGLGRP